MSLALPEIGKTNATEDPRTLAILQALQLQSKVIATEESRTNTAFGTLATPDEITEVVVPTNGLLLINYSALVKSSVAAAGRVAIFIGANQLKKVGAGVPVLQEGLTVGTNFVSIETTTVGLSSSEGTSYVTTGEAGLSAGFCVVRRLAAGTYAISIQYKATSGSITAKERSLQAAVLGF